MSAILKSGVFISIIIFLQVKISHDIHFVERQLTVWWDNKNCLEKVDPLSRLIQIRWPTLHSSPYENTPSSLVALPITVEGRLKSISLSTCRRRLLPGIAGRMLQELATRSA